jgi:hypothetical protein
MISKGDYESSNAHGGFEDRERIPRHIQYLLGNASRCERVNIRTSASQKT